MQNKKKNTKKQNDQENYKKKDDKMLKAEAQYKNIRKKVFKIVGFTFSRQECSTGDKLVVALCRHAWARSHCVPFCSLRSNAAAAVVFPSTQHCRTTMADSASESDTDGAGSSSATPMSSSASNSGKPSIVISQFRLEELTNRLASLQQENKVLKIELETFKLKCKALQEENRDLRKASVTIVSNVS